MGGDRIATLAIASALAAGWILAGCGNDDDDSEALTKQEFSAQANSICKQAEAEMDAALAEAGGGRPTPEQIRTIILPRTQGEIDGIRALAAPEGDEEFIEAMADKAQAAHDEIEADPSIVFSGSDPFAEVNKMAIQYGIPACGT